MGSGEVLGHDCNGRPLRSGDEVVLIEADDPTLSYLVGSILAVIEVDEDGDMIVDAVSYDGYEIGVRSRHIRKLDNHQPAGSFDEVMAGLRRPHTMGESQ